VAEIQPSLAWAALLDLSGRTGPLTRRLASAVRSAIRDGRLSLGAALPPSRTLAEDLGVSRWAVTEAYSQLVTEGYLTARTGSATRVSWTPHPDDDHVGRPVEPARDRPPRPPRYDLYSSRSDLRAFPRRAWVDAIRSTADTASFDQLDRAEPGGHPRLRTVLAERLNRTRGAATEPGTISVFSGAGQAMTQVAHALLADGHTAIGMEDPGSPRLWQAAESAGLTLVPLPADGDGLVTSALGQHPDLRAVCVGAARQIVFGSPLAPHRRNELLAWARDTRGVVVEDDYDAEFSFDRPPPAALQGTDRDHVFLLGSMSKTLSPAVSVGWAVAPRRWVPAVRAEYEIGAGPTTLNQLALARFMESGAYDRYLRDSRRRLRARRNALIESLSRHLPDCRVISGIVSGLDLLLELPDGASADAVVAAAPSRSMHLCDVNGLRFRPDPASRTLLLGYGNLSDSVIEEAAAALADLIRDSY